MLNGTITRDDFTVGWLVDGKNWEAQRKKQPTMVPMLQQLGCAKMFNDFINVFLTHVLKQKIAIPDSYQFLQYW